MTGMVFIVSDMTFRAAAAFQLVNSFMRLPRDSRRVGTGHDWAQAGMVMGLSAKHGMGRSFSIDTVIFAPET